jgi:phenylalanyl-tRNA synthetase beta chain
MYISWNWLQRHVDLTGLDPNTIADRFTMSVAELEGIEEFGATYNKLVSARIAAIKPHENSDKLNIVELDLGNRTIAAISGAPNVVQDAVVVFALPGVVLEGIDGKPEVKVAEIRGFTSPGMTCSERELGFSDDNSGLMFLPRETPLGVPLTDLVPCHDFILEIDNKSITHRPDLWGHRGIAREIAALVNRPMKDFNATIDEGPEEPLTVRVDDPDLCPRYCAQAFDGIKVEESPLWLKIALSLVGVRPISNVVDITNFVMLDVGNPLHAFDARFLEGDTIVVRRARENETITTLDCEERKLLPSDLLIADADRGVALAGVMGGENSEIRDDTTRVVLEAAAFDASGIRRTSSRLGLRTEASARFEKALDPLFPLQATALFSQLLREISPQVTVASKFYDVAEPAPEPTIIRIAPEFIRRKLGAPVETSVMKEMLTGISFGVKEDGDDFVVTVPTFRATKDVSIAEDIVEEIGRLYGYDNIVSAPVVATVKPIPPLPSKLLARWAREAMVACGYNEVMTYSFDSANLASQMDYSLEGALELANVISSDMPVMRRHLLPNMLLHAQKNGQFRDDFRLFEYGRVFYPSPGTIPHQERRICALAYSRSGDSFDLFLRLKAHVESVVSGLGRGEIAFGSVVGADDLPWVVADNGRAIKFGGEDIGLVSMLHPVVRDTLKLRGKIAFFEINLEPIFAAPEQVVKFKPLPRFPAIQNDLSVIVEAEVAYEKVAEVIEGAGGDLLDELELFATFRGDPIPAGKKSLSFHLRFRSPDRTLKDTEVEPLVERVLGALKAEVDGEIRT